MAKELLIPGSLSEALNLNGTFLAGGTEINRKGSFVEADSLIYLKKIGELTGISSEDGTVKYGAMVTFEEAVESGLTPDYFREALMFMASRTKRNMASIGGNIAICRDDSYIIPALVSAGAGLVLVSKDGNEQNISVSSYVNGEGRGKLIKSVIIPAGRKVCNKRFANTAMSHSFVNMSFGYGTHGEDSIFAVAIKNSGIYVLDGKELGCHCEPGKYDAAAFEEKLHDFFNNWQVNIPSDMYGSEEYKRYLIGAALAGIIDDIHGEVR